MNKKRNILIALAMSLVLTMCLAVTAEAETETIPNNRDGFELQNGVTYRVTNNTSVTNLKVANNATVKIIIDQGVTLTARGSDGNGDGVGGNAGIYLPKGSTLILDGGGTLEAYGGNGGNGTDGAYGGRHHSAEWEDNIIEAIGGMGDIDQYGGTGGKGGIGAGGGGAGIGTNGGNGAQPSSRLGSGCGFDFDLCANGRNWTYGDRGQQGASTGDSGDVYNYGVTVKAIGGQSGSAGSAGGGGDKYSIKPAYKVDFGLLGEWNVKETYICYGQGGGGGQSGNAGRAIGPGGGGGGSGHNGNGGAGQCSRNFAATVKTLSYPEGAAYEDGNPGAYGQCGTYYAFGDTSFAKDNYTSKPAYQISQSEVGSAVSLLTKVFVDVKVDNEPVSDRSVYLWEDSYGKTTLELTTTPGRYTAYIPTNGNAKHSVYVDEVNSGHIIVPAPDSGTKTETVAFDTLTADITITDSTVNDAPWTGRSVTMAGGGKIRGLTYCDSGTYAGKYTTLLADIDKTDYTLSVNGRSYAGKVLNHTNKSVRVDFINACVSLTKDGEAWTKGASVFLKQNGRTAYVLTASGSDFVAQGILAGSYDVAVYGSDSVTNTGKTISKDNPSCTDSYYTVTFTSNLTNARSADRVQIRRMDDSATLLSGPYESGFTFAGWKTDASGTNAYTPAAHNTATVVYASWVQPSVKLGTYLRCGQDGTVPGDGMYFKLPNLTIQGYPLKEKIISCIILTMENVNDLNDVNLPEGWYTDEASGSGIYTYLTEDANSYLTVAEAQKFLRGLVFSLTDLTQSGDIQITVYGDTNTEQ